MHFTGGSMHFTGGSMHFTEGSMHFTGGSMHFTGGSQLRLENVAGKFARSSLTPSEATKREAE
jgi:hypothetical protein